MTKDIRSEIQSTEDKVKGRSIEMHLTKKEIRSGRITEMQPTEETEMRSKISNRISTFK